VDVPIKYLNFFLQDDDELEHIKKEYKEGRMLTDEVKQRLIAVLSELVARHQRARAQVTDEDRIKELELKGPMFVALL